MPLPRLTVPRSKPKQTNASEWIKLEKALDDIAGAWNYGDPLNLEDFETIKFKETATDIVVLARLKTENNCCSCQAGQGELKRNGLTAPLMILDEPIRNKRTTIYYRAQRFICPGCLKTIQQFCADCHEDHRLTKRLVGYIERASLDIYQSFAEITRRTGVEERVVRNIFTAHAVKLERERQILTPAWIAIDEVYPKVRNRARCAVTDPAARRVLDLLVNKKSMTLFKWLIQLPKPHQVEVVSIDMEKSFRMVIGKALPKARIVIDRFHVQNLLNVALKEVLDVVRESLTAKESERYMRPEHLLLRSRYHLARTAQQSTEGIKESEQKIVDKWLGEMPDIARAYTLKEDFADILHLSNRQIAEHRTTNWLEQVGSFVDHFSKKYARHCARLRKYPFRNVLKTVRFWRAEILNYIDYKNKFAIRVTNAFAEYVNKEIKQADKKGNGYNFHVLRAKLIHGRFLKEQLAAHPTKARRKFFGRQTAGRRSEAKFLAAERSNLARLQQACEDKDQTKDLIINSRQSPDWSKRFVSDPDERPQTSLFDQGPATPPLIYQASVVQQAICAVHRMQGKSRSGEANYLQLGLFGDI